MRRSTDSYSGRVSLRVWDLPIRLFHWLLAGLIAFSWWTAEYDHLDWHIWSGCAILTLLIFRLLWGVFGSSTARFASFVRGPKSVVRYMRGSRWTAIGHTPLGALSVLALLLVLSVQVGLGLVAEDEDGIVFGPLSHLVSTDTSDTARDIHALNFYLLLALIVLHVAAILFYSFARGKGLTLPMITGRAEVDTATQPMQPGKWWAALLCLAIALGITRWVIAGAPPFGS